MHRTCTGASLGFACSINVLHQPYMPCSHGSLRIDDRVSNWHVRWSAFTDTCASFGEWLTLQYREKFDRYRPKMRHVVGGWQPTPTGPIAALNILPSAWPFMIQFSKPGAARAVAAVKNAVRLHARIDLKADQANWGIDLDNDLPGQQVTQNCQRGCICVQATHRARHTTGHDKPADCMMGQCSRRAEASS